MKRFPFIRTGLIFAISPILLAFVTSLFQGGSMWDEGSGGGGYLWLLMISVPIGLLLIVIAWLSSRTYTYMTGQTITVDGGLSVRF